MKIRLLLNIGLIILFTVSCSEKEVVSDGDSNMKVTEKPLQNYIPDIPLADCIHNALYYLDDTEINFYDSIDTHYFHEILDYTDDKALELEKNLQIFKNSLLVDTLNNIGTPEKLEIEEKIDDLRYELYSYEKKVIGYVFIHTYAIKEDTLSAIIIMTKNCSSSQAIPVNAIKDVDPSDYSYKIHQIESKI